jgi:hypothetical protein
MNQPTTMAGLAHKGPFESWAPKPAAADDFESLARRLRLPYPLPTTAAGRVVGFIEHDLVQLVANEQHRQDAEALIIALQKRGMLP